jgi:hypothetical protein
MNQIFAVKKDLNISFSDIIKIVAGKMEIDSLQKETSSEPPHAILDITEENEVLAPTQEPKEQETPKDPKEKKEEKPKEKEKKEEEEKKHLKLPLNRRYPPRTATLTPKKYVDISTDSLSYSSASNDEEGSDDTVSKSDSFTASEERIETPDSDDLDFIAGSGSLSEEDSEAEFEGDELSSYSSSTISSKDESSSSSDFDSGELLSDDLSL